MLRFQFHRQIHLRLPSTLRGSQSIDRTQFIQTIEVPSVILPITLIEKLKWKKSLLNIPSIKKIRDVEPISTTNKQVLLDPDRIKNKDDLVKEFPVTRPYADQSFDFIPVTLTYENYTIDQVIKAILPEDLSDQGNVNTGSGFSLIGHIAHFNLKTEVLPYKNLIAQVVLDKLPNVKTVLNKIHEIDSLHRNFRFEILAGEENTFVECRENYSTFKFDFARVYWNPRLGTERERIVKKLKTKDLVFDVFAGVGPFIIPAWKLGCEVYGNDINPEAIRWMNVNFQLNQTKNSSLDNVHLSNIDGRDFLCQIVFPRIESFQDEIINDTEKQWCFSDNKIVILMNLPELALTFLDVFTQWLSKTSMERRRWKIPIYIYCYIFSKIEPNVQEIYQRFQEILPDVESDRIRCRFVRRVSPSKDMFCVEILLHNSTF